MSKGNVGQLLVAQLFTVYNGKAYGQVTDPANVAHDVTSHAYLVRDPITANIPSYQRAIRTFKGGIGILGQMLQGVETVGEFGMQFANWDTVLNALAGGGQEDTTSVVGMAISSPNKGNPDPPQLGLMLTAAFQSRASGSDGAKKYATCVFPSGQLDVDDPPLTRAGGDNPSPVNARFVPTKVSQFPNGVAFGANQGWYDNATDHFWIISDKPVSMSIYIADGTTTTFSSAYKPWKSTVTGGNNYNWTTKNGTPTALTSISPTTALHTLAAAGSDFDYWNSMYLTDLVAA